MNWLAGGDGNYELIGNGGMDYFLFNTALNAATNVDELSDFSPLWDTIVIENTIFDALAAGGLAEERFVVGAAAQDGNDNIIYDSATGALMYDNDGTVPPRRSNSRSLPPKRRSPTPISGCCNARVAGRPCLPRQRGRLFCRAPDRRRRAIDIAPQGFKAKAFDLGLVDQRLRASVETARTTPSCWTTRCSPR